METLRYVFVGAHPDDGDINFGGTAILLKQLGHDITFVSVTDGSAGHHQMDRKALAKRRAGEAQMVAEFLGITYIIMDAQDGQLSPDLTNRHKLLRLLRGLRPDVVISPRTQDYHPDHRATAQLVQDCSFLLTVPLICPDTPRLKRSPYIFFHQDDFSKPYEFVPDVLVDITSVIQQKMTSLAFHESQVFEWLPFIRPIAESVPASQNARIEWLIRHWGDPGKASRFAGLFGRPDAKFIEAFERCEYGAQVNAQTAQRLFPFDRATQVRIHT